MITLRTVFENLNLVNSYDETTQTLLYLVYGISIGGANFFWPVYIAY